MPTRGRLHMTRTRLSLAAAAATAIAIMTMPGTASAMGGAAAVRGLTGVAAEPVARVCREWCNDAGICRRRCVDRNDYGYDRDYYRERRHHYDRDRDHDRDRRGPGVDLRI